MPSYQIVGSDLQAVICNLESGEKVIGEAGHLLALTDGLDLETNVTGGVMSGLKRAIGGSSFFVNEIHARVPGQAIFSSPALGKVQELDISPTSSWFCHPSVFLCSDEGVQISSALTQKLGAGLFGGAGFILQALQGSGKAFIHVGGACLKIPLQERQTLRVETGALAAFESTVSYDIQMIRGLKSILFSGEGLWFAHLTGPGTVYVQSLAMPRLAHSLAPYLPSTQTNVSEAGVIGGIVGRLLSGG